MNPNPTTSRCMGHKPGGSRCRRMTACSFDAGHRLETRRRFGCRDHFARLFLSSFMKGDRPHDVVLSGEVR